MDLEGRTQITAQPGPQTEFLRCSADVAFYGGAAGGGKTFALLLDALRGVNDPNYRAVIFRRESTQITVEGGLWDESSKIYPHAQGEPVQSPNYHWCFPSGARVSFRHLQHEKHKRAHQGAQYSVIGFDELPHFNESQFVYLMSRNRTDANMTPYVRATMNPDADSWVYKWVRPFLKEDGKTPDPDKCGELRYFTITNGELVWVGEGWRDEDGNPPKSFTFIPATLDDNPALLEKNPRYKSDLRAQSEHVQDRLLRGLWVTERKKAMFRNHLIRHIKPDEVPDGLTWARYWDLADTEVDEADQDPTSPDGPDWTAGAKGALWQPGEDSEWYDPVREDPIMIVADCDYFQLEGDQKDSRMLLRAQEDGHACWVGFEVEGGSSGKYVGRDYEEGLFEKWNTYPDRPTGDKVERAKPWRRLAERGRVWLVDGEWVAQYLWWVERFPHHKKDVVDATSGLHKMLTDPEVGSGDWYFS